MYYSVSILTTEDSAPLRSRAIRRLVCQTELSLQSRAHFSDPIFQKSSKRHSLLRFLREIELSLQSRAHFANPIFQKSSERDSFSTCSSANRAPATVLCAFCRQLLQIKARTRGNRDPTSATTETTLPQKTGFRARESFQA